MQLVKNNSQNLREIQAICLGTKIAIGCGSIFLINKNDIFRTYKTHPYIEYYSFRCIICKEITDIKDRQRDYLEDLLKFSNKNKRKNISLKVV